MRIYLAILAVLGWFALIAQFYINITSKAAPIPEIIIRYFSYFTLLTNALVALCCTFLLLKSNSRLGRFFSHQTTLGAITFYITVVGIVYNIILRSLWNPEGLQLIVDELLHSVIPVLFVLYWLIFAPKGGLQWKDVLAWMIYPLVYIIFILIRGSLSGFYPYPFFDIHTLGLSKVLINSIGFTIAFLAGSLLLVAVGKLTGRTSR